MKGEVKSWILICYIDNLLIINAQYLVHVELCHLLLGLLRLHPLWNVSVLETNKYIVQILFFLLRSASAPCQKFVYFPQKYQPLLRLPDSLLEKIRAGKNRRGERVLQPPRWYWKSINNRALYDITYSSLYMWRKN